MKKIIGIIISAIMGIIMIGSVPVSAEKTEVRKTKVQVCSVRDLVLYLTTMPDAEVVYSDSYMTIWYEIEEIPKSEFDKMVEIYHIDEWSDIRDHLDRIGWDWEAYEEYCENPHLVTTMLNYGEYSLVLTV